MDRTLFLTFFLLATSIILLFSPIAKAQDTIIQYDVFSQTITEIPPIGYDTTLVFDNTPSSIGSMGNAATLDLTTPTTNLFSGTNFTDIARAELFYNVTDYPIRTGTKLFGYQNDTLMNDCSGILVAPNFVLTAAHCIRNYTGESWLFDSMLVAPAFDNGNFQTSIGSSAVENYYIFKTFYDRKSFDDIALIQLKEPLGFNAGWVGIAFSSDTAYFNNKVFHKLSYPMVPDPFDTTRIYNGDTLYYNFGNIDVLGQFLGIGSGTATGVPGQSGSSIFYTDNVQAYSLGVFSFSGQYRHTQITNNIFHQFESIMAQNAVAIKSPEIAAREISIYPNPFSQQARIAFDYSPNAEYDLLVFNVTGSLVRKIENIDSGRVLIERDDLTDGLYFVHLLKNGEILASRKMVIH